jgi:phospholipase/carboxylesterase
MLEYIVVNEKEAETVICLHGFGATPENMSGIAHGLENYRCIFPRAPFKFLGGYGWYNVLKGDKENREKAISSIVEFIEEMQKKFSFKKCFLLGFSQGAELTYQIATDYPEKFKGAVGIVGWLASTSIQAGKKSVPILIINGSLDVVLPPNWCKGECIKKSLEQKNIDCELQIFRMGHEISRECAAYIKEWLAKHK